VHNITVFPAEYVPTGHTVHAFADL